ncbi:hypothetical protein ACFVWF_32205 [Rhodococcus qingshengii]|uniref:hypothetical protein n=1 Tax=Rhodococcus qingshengii TaxID=334542 RepID=UPI0036DEF3B3
MTPEQIRAEAIERIGESLWIQGGYRGDPKWRDLLPEEQAPYREKAVAAVIMLGGLLPTGGIRYAVAHPVTGTSDPRFVGFTLEECKEFATEYDTHVIEQHLTEWSRHE